LHAPFCIDGMIDPFTGDLLPGIAAAVDGTARQAPALLTRLRVTDRNSHFKWKYQAAAGTIRRPKGHGTKSARPADAPWRRDGRADAQARGDPAVFPVAALAQDDPEICEPYELDDITEERHVVP
jgi:hypothetical protein